MKSDPIEPPPPLFSPEKQRQQEETGDPPIQIWIGVTAMVIIVLPVIAAAGGFWVHLSYIVAKWAWNIL